MSPLTLFDKVWNEHVVKQYDDGSVLLYVDRHLVQEVSSPQAFEGLIAKGRRVRRIDAQVSVADHAVPTRFRNLPLPEGQASRQVRQRDRFRLGEIVAFDILRELTLHHVKGREVGLIVCGPWHAPAYDRLAREINDGR